MLLFKSQEMFSTAGALHLCELNVFVPWQLKKRKKICRKQKSFAAAYHLGE